MFDRTSAYTGGTGGLNRVVGVTFSVGPNTLASECGLIVLGTVNSAATSLFPAHYGIWSQMTRSPTSRGHITGIVTNVTDQTGLPSSTAGPNLLGIECGIFANDVDDGANASVWGGVGVRRLFSSYVNRQNAGTEPVSFSYGFVIGTPNFTIGSVPADPTVSISSGIGFALNSCILNALDTRGLVAPTGMTDPVAAVRMQSEQIIDFHGGPALRSAPGSYLQYTSTGTARLRYVAGATEVFSAADNGSLIAGKGSAGATTDTGGHLLIPFCAGTPTGVPANAALGIALRYDTTAHKLWAYDNGTSTWKGVALT